MQKFDDWNDEKKALNSKKREDFYINPREIWYTKMGVNIGFEDSMPNGQIIKANSRVCVKTPNGVIELTIIRNKNNLEFKPNNIFE